MKLFGAQRTTPPPERSLPGSAAPDYADAFRIPLPTEDRRDAEQLFRAGTGSAPGLGNQLVLWAHRHLLRFDLGPFSSPQHVMGWQVVAAEAGMVALQAHGPLMNGLLELRRDNQFATLSTYLEYRHPAAHIVWQALGPVHRALAPRLLENCAR
ncbi:hypothetical protein [Mycobacterium sp. SMC-4]|uniref:hypothetical protein n=1 Tax=Mycobacterium sp. SMC-4 TaxID=2857059 RepID=UPI0021B1AA2F|nr:hypothetical protein [Mycobacterium sp. SMC-4]UXA18465.1 hypothetical protein KXD98_01700 [Mycobacterium sp. SMC-4]